ncbi:MAG TPA: TetR/AcrR family transcriptional regulator [Blastococcus sp.]|nr:TetR/AcrR family transcriptional regulator [Blastococcus sp.]
MTETTQRRDRRADRHAATKREILDAAWALSRERGLAGWALRDVAEAVGMRAPSLYVYFASKNALYDAMFADGYAALHARAVQLENHLAHQGAAPVEVARAGAAMFVDFCVEEPARMQLLFLRTIPGFEPSADAYALAQQPFEQMTAVLVAAGMGSAQQVDLWTALLTGLATQQISNDPGGDRWSRLVEPAVDMFVAAHLPPAAQDGPG